MKLPFFLVQFLERLQSYPMTSKQTTLMEDNFQADNFLIHEKELFLDEQTNGRLKINLIKFLDGRLKFQIMLPSP